MPLPLSPPRLIPRGAVRAIDRILARQASSQCVLQRPTTELDEVGQETGNAWYTVGVYSCQVIPPGGGTEAQFAGRVASDADYVVKLPRWADPRGEDQILVNGGTLQVVYVPRFQSDGLRLSVIAKSRR